MCFLSQIRLGGMLLLPAKTAMRVVKLVSVLGEFNICSQACATQSELPCLEQKPDAIYYNFWHYVLRGFALGLKDGHILL